MKPLPVHGVLPQLLNHKFWKNRERFYMEVDVYSNWIMLIVEEGSFEYEIGDMIGIGQAGDLLLCPPSVPFRRKMVSNLTFHFINFRWRSVVGQSNVTEPFLLSEIPAGIIALHNRARLKSNCDYLKQLIDPRDPSDIFRINHLLADTWLLCCQEAEQSKRTRWSPDPMMNAALKRINETFYDYDFCMKKLLDDLGLSPIQFSRKFKRAFGMAPSEYVMEQRLNKVRLLLAESTLSLQKIADLCGFENGNYLCRLFFKKMNIKTTEYRRLYKQ
ncbi:helix-turn-helix transcriptional regulator [Paenibacillus sp. MBLB4367]|uniref:helix-turn-helix transcriptional regulator n=1 Tax=Paenibacillus sp. MBLB4367 TaxID=3384767 RepID=UPI0039083C8A